MDLGYALSLDRLVLVVGSRCGEVTRRRRGNRGAGDGETYRAPKRYLVKLDEKAFGPLF